MTERVDKYILKNGMVLVGEPMEEVRSAAFVFMLPAGEARLPEGCCGAGSVICDWIFRGAGNRNSRQLSEILYHHSLINTCPEQGRKIHN